MERFKRHKIVIGAAVFLAVAGVAAGVVHWRGRKMQAEATVKQSTLSLKKMDLVKSVSATGTIESKSSKSVSSSVRDSTVAEVMVSVGDTVKKGDILVTFEKEALEGALEESEESLAEAKSDAAREIVSAQRQLDRAVKTGEEEKSRLASKITKARKEKASAKKALAKAKKKAASVKNASDQTARQEELARAEETWNQAQTAYETAIENRDNTNRQNETAVENARTSLENARSNGDKSIRQARSQLEEAQDSLKQCSVEAPAGGLVTAVNVAAGDSYSGGTLLQIADVSAFVVTTTVDEYDISDVETGQKTVILTEATDEEELEGEIIFVAPSTGDGAGSGTQDASGLSSGSEGYEVRIAVKTQDDRLKLGMTARCSIVLEEAADVFAVPYDAVHEKEDDTCVIYVAEDSAAKAVSGAAASDPGSEQEKESGAGVEPGDGKGPGGGQRPEFGQEDRAENGAGPDVEPDSEEDRKKSTDRGEDSKNTGVQREIVVIKGMESDYYVEISGDGLYEGMKVIIPTDETTDASDDDASQGSQFGMPGAAGMYNGGRREQGGSPQDMGDKSGGRP